MSRPHAACHRPHPREGDLRDRVQRYYDEKTARILAKYGPGPRVHFHSGLRAEPARPSATQAELREAMVRSQEALLEHVAPRVRGPRVLDVGCGLGGGALYWAEELGARVTAVTNVAAHVPLVAAFADRAGVKGVEALHRDAHALEGLGPFDAVVAIESSCYLDRRAWFAALAGALAPGGVVHVVDCFLGSELAARRFDAYWQTRVGTRRGYDEAARAAGFARVAEERLDDAVVDFWSLSSAWSFAALRGSAVSRARLGRSISEHGWLQDSLRAGDIEYAWLTYERRARR